ncbi:hypothetical protein Bca101_002379 [Brassica carinata]
MGCSAVAAAMDIAVHTEEDILAEDNPAVVDNPVVGSLAADIPEEEDNLAADKTPLDIPQADNLNIKVV